jgi:hypothetical protein
MMLGKMRLKGTMYRGASRRLWASSRRSFSAAVSRPARRALTSRRDEGARPVRQPVLDAPLRPASRTALCRARRRIVIRNGNRFEPANLPGSVAARIRGMLAVRDAVRLVFRPSLRMRPRTHHRGAKAPQRHLRFLRRGTARSLARERQGLRRRPRPAAPLSLENYDPETKRATKTAIFERRTLERYKPVEHVETAAEALAVSLNETGEIHWPRMEQLTGRSPEAVAARAGQPRLPQPRGGGWETADRYLSGNVRAKLDRDGRGGARSRPTAQYRGLKAVQPADLEPGDIERPPRLVVDSGERHPKEFVATARHPRACRPRQPRRRHRHLGVDARQRREINVSNTTTWGTRAGAPPT